MMPSKFLLIVLAITGFMQSALAVSVGEPAPIVTLPSLTGDADVALDQFRDKVVYLDFWASWCAPCRTSFPILQSWQQKYQEQGFTVVAINLDEDKDAALRFLQHYPVTFTTLRDAQEHWAEVYAIEAMPTSFLINRQGVIHSVHSGFTETGATALEQQIQQLLRQP
ncbi:MAG: TlpA disulfide reductase family protein [Methylococcales bacterium]|nr:TlpA disulfide reductase family protein [Methylococcales bacterium]